MPTIRAGDKVEDTNIDEVQQDAPEAKPEAQETPREDVSDLKRQLAAANTQAAAERRKRQEIEQESHREQLPTDNFVSPADVDRIVNERLSREKAQAEEQRQAQEWQDQHNQFEAKLKESDAADLVDSVGVKISQLAPSQDSANAIAGAIKSSNNPAAILAALDSDPAQLEAISKMSPVNAALALGRLDIAPTAPTTLTPDPTEDVSGLSSISKSVDEMSPQEYAAHLRKTNGGSVFL